MKWYSLNHSAEFVDGGHTQRPIHYCFIQTVKKDHTKNPAALVSQRTSKTLSYFYSSVRYASSSNKYYCASKHLTELLGVANHESKRWILGFCVGTLFKLSAGCAIADSTKLIPVIGTICITIAVSLILLLF